MPFPAHWKVSKKKLRVQPKNPWIFPTSDSSSWDARQQAGQHQPQRRSNRRLGWKKCRKNGENPRNSQRYREKLNLSESFLGQSILNVNYVFATWHYLNIRFERLQEKVVSFPSKQRTSCKCSSAMTGKKGESRTDDLPMTKRKMSGCHCSAC